MTPERMKLAAEHLRLNANILYDSCTVNGMWELENAEEQSDCEEMRALADELDAEASDMEETWAAATAPQTPRTKEENERDAAMFAGLAKRLQSAADSMPNVKADSTPNGMRNSGD